MQNIYQPFDAVIENIIEETQNIKTFSLRTSENFSFTTGQFIELSVPGMGEGPFTPSSDPEIKGKIDVTVMNVGRITKILHGMKKGDKVGLRGPFGKGYPLNEFAGKEVLIVGGGVGLAPLRSLVFALFHRLADFKRVSLRYGSRSPKDIVFKYLLPDWAKKIEVIQTVDVGDEIWKGKVGLVTTVLDELDFNLAMSVAIVCGPPIMMKFVTLKLLEKGFSPGQIYLSMEKNMSCGLGKCGHCRIGPYYVCQDGPVFTYKQLENLTEVWD